MCFQPPGQPADISNQGKSVTCTHHALANVIVDQLDADGVDVNHSHVVQTLIKRLRIEQDQQEKAEMEKKEAVWPDRFNNFSHTILTKDEKTKKWISVKIKAVEKVDRFDPTKKHVLTY